MNDTNVIPTHSDFLDTLLQNLSSSAADTTTATTARPLPPAAKQLLLTLHVLHPHHTLEALDLLDRGLVTRLIIRRPTALSETASSEETATKTLSKQYHVRSAQGASHRPYYPRDQSPAASESSNYYNVHIAAWSCSCPAFAYAAYPSTTTAVAKTGEFAGGERLGFGGLPRLFAGDDVGGMTLPAPPLCKHLLACVLAEECGELFGVVDAAQEGAGMSKGCVGIREKFVSAEEAAGWAAGGGGFG